MTATRPSVLVVDNDRATRELIGLHLRNTGYEVVEAEDAIVAGWQLLRSPPDLLIVDADLPYLNGIEFLATLVADSTVPYVSAILLASRDSLASRAEALGVSCLVKPFFADQLRNLVEKHLEARPRFALRA